MAGITNAKLVITHPAREQVGTTTAIIAYSFSYTLKKEQDEHHSGYEDHVYYIEATTYYYEDPIYTIEYPSGHRDSGVSTSGSVLVTDLTEGSENSISITFTVEVPYSIHIYRQRGDKVLVDRWVENLSYSASSTASLPDKNDEDSKPVWTRPGAYFFEKHPKYEIEQGDYIHEKLTASVMDEWGNLLNVTGHWFKQNEQNAKDDPIYITYCKVQSGDIITANWFNACISLLTKYEGFLGPPLNPDPRAKATAGGPGVYEETSYITAARINLMLGANGAKGEVSLG